MQSGIQFTAGKEVGLRLQAAFWVMWSLHINFIILPNGLPDSVQIKYSYLSKVSELGFSWNVSCPHFNIALTNSLPSEDSFPFTRNSPNS